MRFTEHYLSSELADEAGFFQTRARLVVKGIGL